MKNLFTNKEGGKIVSDLIKTIQANKNYLSDLDGAIGDGDHGINMNKGFTRCEQELNRNPGDLAYSLKMLSQILMREIGGSMGPLYGMFFEGMASECVDQEVVDAKTFGKMLMKGEALIKEIGNAEVGDKTLLDTLVPAVQSYTEQIEMGKGFNEGLAEMKKAAVRGRDSTKEMIARVGRASRLGERSRGVLDAGATSCCLILLSMADSIIALIEN
jgi:dihydroxyacetone kinase-like protein